MRIAFFSDIHGNLPALQAAYNDALERSVSAFYCAGDLVGYGPYPSEVCTFILDHQIATISGNYDMKVCRVFKNPKKLKRTMKPDKWRILNWTRTHTTPRTHRFLLRLPKIWRQELPNRTTLIMAHGSPRSQSDPIYPSITDRGLRAVMGDVLPNLFIVGHTHIPFVTRIGPVLVVNCGSIGQPVDGDPRGAYALISLQSGFSVKGEIIRFEYSMTQIVKKLQRSSMPAYLARDLVLGRKRRESP